MTISQGYSTLGYFPPLHQFNHGKVQEGKISPKQLVSVVSWINHYSDFMKAKAQLDPRKLKKHLTDDLSMLYPPFQLDLQVREEASRESLMLG